MTSPGPSAQRDASLAAIGAALSEAKSRSARSQPMLDARLADLSNRARSGELGADWQRVQRRVDAGEATLTGVFAGTDDDPDAQALRQRAQERVARLTETALAETQAHSPGSPEAASDDRPDLGAIRGLPAELERRLAELRDMAERLGRAT